MRENLACLPNKNSETNEYPHEPKINGLRKLARILGLTGLVYFFGSQPTSAIEVETGTGYITEESSKLPTEVGILLQHNYLRTHTADEAVVEIIIQTLEHVDLSVIYSTINELRGEVIEPEPSGIEILSAEEMKEVGLKTSIFSPSPNEIVLGEAPVEQMAGELARQTVCNQAGYEHQPEIGQYYANRWLVEGVSDDFFQGATTVVTEIVTRKSGQKADIRHFYDAKYAVARLVCDLVGEDLFAQSYFQGDFSLLIDRLKDIDPSGRIVASVYSNDTNTEKSSLSNTHYLGDLIFGNDNDVIPLFAIRSCYEASEVGSFEQAITNIAKRTEGVCQIKLVDGRFPGIIVSFNHPALFKLHITAAIRVPLPNYIDQYLIFGENGRKFNNYFQINDAPEELMSTTRERAIPYRAFNLPSSNPLLTALFERFEWGNTKTREECFEQILKMTEELVGQMQEKFSELMPTTTR